MTKYESRYDHRIVKLPKKINTKNAQMSYSGTTHRMLLYAKFKNHRGFTRTDWHGFHSNYKMRRNPYENLVLLVSYGLLRVDGETRHQRFYITPHGEMKLIRMAEINQEREAKKIRDNLEMNVNLKRKPTSKDDE